MEVLKVSAVSQPKSVAGAIAAIIRNNKSVEINAIGANSVNQAVKSIAVARSYLVTDEIDIVCAPSFSQIELDSEIRTSIKFVVERRAS